MIMTEIRDVEKCMVVFENFMTTSQSVVGAVIGAGFAGGAKNIQFGVLKRVALAWVSSPTIAGFLTWLVAVCTKSYFG